MATKTIKVFIPPMKTETLRVTIKGDALIVHRFGAKAGRQLMEQGKPKEKKKPRTPESAKAAYEDAFYLIHKNGTGGRFSAKDGSQIAENPPFNKKKHLYGIPTSGIKRALESATIDLDNVAKTQIRRNVFVMDEKYGDLTPLTSEPPWMREDIVRLNTMARPPDLRYRPQFDNWSVTFLVRFDTSVFDREAVLHLLTRAGQKIGLHERRPEKEGTTYGTFTIDEVELIDGESE